MGISKKYFVIGGPVRSRSDGDEHYVNSKRLCELYGVDPKECVMVESADGHKRNLTPGNLIVLKPRSDGNYQLPDEVKRER